MAHAAPRPRRWRRPSVRLVVIGAGVLGMVLCLTAATGIGYVYWKTGRFQRANLALDAIATAQQPRNYLIIGSDSRDNVDPHDPDAGAILGPGTPPGGKRSDTILLVRVDPTAGTAAMLSFPRDLWVPMADTGQNDRINAAYGRGRQVLVDTIRKDFGVEVNNYIEVDFNGFKDLVSAIGGVPMYFDTAMRDDHTGLDIEQPGCVTLDGDQALAFARSRYLQYRDARGRWVSDPTSDLGRITRQQVFVRKALHKTFSLGITDLPTFTRLLNVAVDSVTIDQTLDRHDLYDLVQRYRAFQPDDIATYSLPATPFTTAGGADVLRLDVNGAQPALDIFRGINPAIPTEASIHVAVLNGSGTPGQARDVTQALTAIGFRASSTGNAPLSPGSVIRYPSASEAAADLLGRHLTTPATLVADPTLPANNLTLVTGHDFTTVMQTPRPITATNPAPDTPTTPTTTMPTTTTTVIGRAPGQTPPGVTC